MWDILLKNTLVLFPELISLQIQNYKGDKKCMNFVGDPWLQTIKNSDEKQLNLLEAK